MKTEARLRGYGMDDFECFFRLEYQHLFRALVLASLDREEAEDLAQEAMVRLLERWDSLGHVDSKHAYLFTVAFNLLRRRRRRDALLLRLLRGRGPELSIQGPEQMHELIASIAKLPAGQRDALVLVEWLGFSPAEAAVVLHIKPVSVRGRLHDARQRLQRDLEVEVTVDE